MKIVELVIDEYDELAGIEAISVVESPAIEEDFIALKKQEVKLAELDKEKRILLGPLLIPNKPIYRKNAEEEYYIYFSRETVRKASEGFLMKGNQSKSTLEHQHSIKGLTLVESWIVEDEQYDKSRKYGLDVPVGTWMGAIKVNNDEVWNEYVKTGKVKGFSVEGYFADKAKKKKKDSLSEIESEEILEAVRKLFSEKITLESYNDYPQSVVNNAKRGIELNKKVNNKCATLVGKNRARQLVAKEKLSVSTIKRLYSYLSRAETYYDPKDNEACGTISFLLWGGKSAKNWAESKLKKLGELKLKSEVVDENYAIIMDRLAYSSKDMAEKIAEDIGCKGTHEHEFEGKTWYMPCEKHAMAKVGPRGGIVKSPKAPGSRKNKNPKGVGSAGGSAKGRTGAKVTAKDREALQKKVDNFNKRYKEKLGYGVTLGQLSAVFQRGLGAFNTSSSPRVKSASQWARKGQRIYVSCKKWQTTK